MLNTGHDLRLISAEYMVVMTTESGIFIKSDVYFDWGDPLENKKGKSINYAHLVNEKGNQLKFTGYGHMINFLYSCGWQYVEKLGKDKVFISYLFKRKKE